MLTAMARPGWLDLSRREAAIAGGLALPATIVGSLSVVGGTKAAKRHAQWERRNYVTAPKTGNGLLVVGSFMTLGFAAGAAYGAQRVIVDPSPERGAWAPTIVAGGGSVLGMVVLTAGMLKRSKLADWKRTGYVVPGTMALQRGGGVAISGRF